MTIFNRFDEAWSLDGLEPPWGDRPSIYESIRARLEPEHGTLPHGFALPDSDRLGNGSGIPWAPGALDGVLGHHAGAQDERLRAKQIAKAVRDVLHHATDAKLEHLYRLACSEPLLACVDGVIEELARTNGFDVDRFRNLALYLAMRAADREPVKLGIALLGCVSGSDDRDVLMTLGAHDELTLYVAVALEKRPEASEGDLWRLARRVHGWGRIQLVERLIDTQNPEIRGWMLREGFRNQVMHEYLAYTCATTGGLHAALEREEVDETLLRGAGDILVALVDAQGGPAEGIDAYPDGAHAAECYLRHAERQRCSDLGVVLAASALRRFLGSDQYWDELTDYGWTAERREGIATACDRILRADAWRRRIIDALQSGDDEQYQRGDAAAAALGIDTWDHHRNRLEHDPVDPCGWSRLLQQSDGDRLEAALALAEDRLPLDEIACGPAEELGLGPRFRAHDALDVLLQELGRFPGRGGPLVGAALRSPVVRNRHTAVRTLAAWGRHHWPPEAHAALETAVAREPDDSVRERMRAALEGEPLPDY